MASTESPISSASKLYPRSEQLEYTTSLTCTGTSAVALMSERLLLSLARNIHTM